ncbi:MAG TPA: ABC transporter ATP-binding protein [Humidesulfovibrio sp.]|uniref:ABC transporter ATP-binding protein n=1 Tax=Humidesulfovibrio sp. TaxID=2910988 RepID=UPI002CF4634D|nr:ABC transporter ATP-binding protein [Humidesulfovibrio sp.]HWR03708.1 ABC transporter ATP-binding protein [Humidesulfovibrio sp.]
MIRARGLHCGYGGHAVLHGLDLHLAPGEFAALLGPNGSGKTTLLSALAGLITPMRGAVELAGRDLTGLPARERAKLVSCVPQGASAPQGYTVRELVRMGRFAHTGFLGGYGPQDEEAAQAALIEAGCLDLAERQAAELSGGEYQRVLLARALCQGRAALLLDEATSALDLARRVEAFDLLARQHAAGGTILAAVHDLNLAALYCPRLIFLKAGRVALDGPTLDVFTEANLKDIYETDLRVAPHPVTGAPQAHLVPGAGARASL